MKRLIIGVVFSIGMMMLVAVYAENVTAHPIDVFLKKCMEREPSTFGTIECIRQAAKKWEIDLTKSFSSLYAKLGNEAKTALKKAQQKWLLYRQVEIEYTHQFYSQLQGTMYRVFAADRVMSITRERALKLAQHIELLENSR